MPCTREAYPHGVGCIRWLGPAGRRPAPTELTQTFKRNGASSARNTPTCFCFFLRSATFLRRGGTAGDARHYISLKETRDGFVLALTFVCKVKTEERGKKKKNCVYFRQLKHSEALKTKKSLNESSQNHSRRLVMPLTVSH